VKQTRYTEAQIVDVLAQAAKGEMTAIEVCRINGISEQTFYRWKRRYGEMTTSEVKRLRELEPRTPAQTTAGRARPGDRHDPRRAPGKMSGAPEKRHTVRVLAAAGISTRRACSLWAPRAPILPTGQGQERRRAAGGDLGDPPPQAALGRAAHHR